MATSGVNFLSISSTVLAGSAVHTAVATAPYLEAMDSEQAAEIEDMAGGTIVDRVLVDLGRKSAPKFGEALLVGGAFSGAYAKNGSALLSTTGTTAVTVSLAALATATGVSAVAGDTAFATVNQLVFRNLSDADMTVASGASNGLDIGLSASATLTVPAGSVVTIQSAAGLTVDGSHKNLTVTPTSGGVLALSVGGA